jgi:hypothetical protein
MAELEKVLNALENCTAHPKCMDCGWKECEHEHETVEIPLTLAKDAISLLKAQEPRVMKFDELEDTIADRAVWYEAFLTEVPTIAIVCEKSIADDAYTIFDFISGRHRVTRKTYGAAWRCWTSRPTDEQREAAKWE